MDILSIVVYVCWLLSEVILNRQLRSNQTDKKDADKSSLRAIWITLALAVTAGSFIAGYISLPIGNYSIVHPTGLALILLGMLFRFIAVRSLGKMFTVDVTIRQDHALNTAGVYKYVRHPSYSGSLVSFIGMGVALNNWLSVIIIVVPVFISFIYRVNVEERVLQEQFGNEYRDYMKKSHRFFPFIY